MGYITIANSKRMISKLDPEKLKKFEGEVYKKPIYFFNQREKCILLALKSLLKDPNNFLIEYYAKIETEDSLRYVIPEKEPAYHTDNSCKRLNSNYNNYEIPSIIREKGKDEVIKFRNWYTEFSHLLEEDTVKFIYQLQIKFPYVGEITPKSIERKNSGFEIKENITVEEIEKEIDDLLRAAGAYYKNNPDKQNIIKRFGRFTFLGYYHQEIYKNETELNDEDLKTFLREYDENFKKPIKILISEYYKLTFNPDMTFEGALLENLGFRACKACHT